MNDYTYPSIYFAYLFFALMFGLAVFFFVKSVRSGYWGKDSEEAKFRMLQDEDELPKRRHP
jgi:hypothetical protein